MSLRSLFISLSLSVVFIGFAPNFTQAQTCQDVGAACRPGWISGCGAGETPIGNSCPFNSNGSLICCQFNQTVNECTNAGGLCRSDLYATNGSGDPACGYNGDIQSSEACSGPQQICCLPPPNIGATCGSGGSCQLPGNCTGGGNANAACFGGAVCCSPLLDSFTVPENCTILTGQFSCSITISWSISNPVSPLVTVNGSTVSNAAASASTVVFVDYGLNIFEISDGPTSLMTRPSSGSCESGSNWDGSMCVAAVSTNTLTVPLSCNIPLGQSTCDISVSWSVSIPTNPTIAQNSTVFSLAASGTNVTRTINYGTTLIDLSNNGAIVDTVAVDGYCAPGTIWDGSICAAAAGSTLSVPLSCNVPIGQSTCDITISWNVASPVNPRVEQDGGLISLAPSSSGTVVTLVYGTTSLFDLSNNGVVIDTAPSDAYCATGSIWDATTGQCMFSNGSGDSCAVGGVDGQCYTTAYCTSVSGVNAGPSTCTNPEVCCQPPSSPPPPPPMGSGDPCQVSGVDGQCFTSSYCTSVSGVNAGPSTCTNPEVCCQPPGSPPSPPSGPPTSPTTVNYPNPLFTDDLSALIAKFLVELQRLIATLAIIFIVIGAFLYITSAGDTGRIELGKKCILGALIGLALGIAAPMFFQEIATLLGWTPVGLPAPTNTLLGMAMGVVNFLLAIIGVIALIMLVVGAFMYLTAAGDESRIDTGKEIVKYSIIGITVALAALVLVRMVVNFF